MGYGLWQAREGGVGLVKGISQDLGRQRVCFSSEGFRRDWVLPSGVETLRVCGWRRARGEDRPPAWALVFQSREATEGGDVGSRQARPAVTHYTVLGVSWRRVCRAKSVHSPISTWPWALGKTKYESGCTGVGCRASCRAVPGSQYWGGIATQLCSSLL